MNWTDMPICAGINYFIVKLSVIIPFYPFDIFDMFIEKSSR